MRRACLQPSPCRLEHRPLEGAHKDGIEHRVVGDQDVRGRLDHVPAGQHLALPGIRELAEEGITGADRLQNVLEVADYRGSSATSCTRASPIRPDGVLVPPRVAPV